MTQPGILYCTFDVAVNLPLRVQVFQSLENLSDDGGNVDLVETAATRLGHVQSRAAAQILHDDPQFAALQLTGSKYNAKKFLF